MSGLVLYKPQSATGGACMEPGCGNSGRFTPIVAGYVLKTPMGVREALCRKHATEWSTLWQELCAADAPGPTEQALRQFAESAHRNDPLSRHERAEAIDTLRELGYERPVVLRAKDELLGGASVEQALAGLEVDEPAAVA